MKKYLIYLLEEFNGAVRLVLWSVYVGAGLVVGGYLGLVALSLVTK